MSIQSKTATDDILELYESSEPWYNWTFYSENLQIEITLLRWGFGFDFGYHHQVGCSLWLGPFYISIGL